jgi:hypothetical protein
MLATKDMQIIPHQAFTTDQIELIHNLRNVGLEILITGNILIAHQKNCITLNTSIRARLDATSSSEDLLPPNGK